MADKINTRPTQGISPELEKLIRDNAVTTTKIFETVVAIQENMAEINHGFVSLSAAIGQNRTVNTSSVPATHQSFGIELTLDYLNSLPWRNYNWGDSLFSDNKEAEKLFRALQNADKQTLLMFGKQFRISKGGKYLSRTNPR